MSVGHPVRWSEESVQVGGVGRRRLLVCYSNASTFTTTTAEFLESFGKESSWEVHYLHVTHRARPQVDLAAYDAVLISYCARLCLPDYVSEHFLELLDQFEGVRAIAIQDEYDFVERERLGLDRVRPHVVFTCVPPDQREVVYPSARYPETEFRQVLTGYVPLHLSGSSRMRPIADRPIHVGYRGRDLGPRYGRLARMKFDIGRVFQHASVLRKVPCDIAMDEASRIYGDAWYRWLGNCRAVLGTESGSNIFDFDGSIDAVSRSAQGRPLPALVQREIDELDRTFRMGQISPRVFEAAAMGTALVLYEGRYSDALVPYEHYIPVAHDHSNMDEIFRAIADLDGLQAMVSRARAHLIDSGLFGYRAFVQEVEAALERQVRRPPAAVEAPVDPPSTDMRQPALLERPTTSPRAFDSFQLRAVLTKVQSPLLAPSLPLRAMGLGRVRSMLARLAPSILGR